MNVDDFEYSENFYGHVELCSAERFAGWVWNPDRPLEREIVQIFVGNVLVASLEANEFRQDLRDAGIGDGLSGFSISPFQFASESSLRIIAKHSGVRLRISDPYFNAWDEVEPIVVPQEKVDIISSAVDQDHSLNDDCALGQPKVSSLKIGVTPKFSLVGVVLQDSDCRLVRKVSLFSEDLLVATTNADKPVDRIFGVDQTVANGFVFQLPEPVYANPLRPIRVVCEDVEATLVIDYRKRFTGQFERYEYANSKLRLAGWAHDKLLEFSSIKLDVFYEGEPVGSVLANRMRPDLQKAGIGLGNHSFDAILSLNTQTFELDRLELSFEGAGLTLPRANLARFDISASILARASVSTEQLRLPPNEPGFTLSKGETSRAFGHVDLMSPSEIRGWAFDPDDPDKPVSLDFLVDGQLVESTRTDRFRADLAQKFSSAGYHGFTFEVLPQYKQTQQRVFTIAVRRGLVLENGSQRLKLLPDHVALAQPFAPKIKERYRSPFATTRISLVVLNLNGSRLLQEFYASLQRYEAYKNYEIIVIDHGSTDDSAAVSAAVSELDIKFVERGRNYSFSASNNYGARLATGDIIICLNNDIFWCQSILGDVAKALADKEVGCVGVQLLDTPHNETEVGPPIVQTIGIHFNFQLRDRAIHPVETRYDTNVRDFFMSKTVGPGVTGAFLAMRKADFLAVGGFDEEYNYGYEDVDLCLKVLLDLKLSVECLNSVRAFHHRGYSRKKSGKWAGSNMSRNRRRLEANFAYRIRRDLLDTFFDRASFWQGRPLVIAFAVTEASNTTAAGDFFTAAEFGEALVRRIGAKVIFLEEKVNWYDVEGVDVLIVMRHEYKLENLVNAKASLVTVGWARNWFEKWVEVSSARDYNLLCASGDEAVSYMADRLERPVFKLAIATNTERFYPAISQATKSYDVVFSGSFWGHPREIIYRFRPEFFAGAFKVFGVGWDQLPEWAPYYEGLKAYNELPDIYRNTKIVLDDANSVTKAWGSVNSRVYDAIAAGCLVVTNGQKGAQAEFGGLLPSYDTSHELHDILNTFLNDPQLLGDTCSRLRAEVLDKHTYDHRVTEFVGAVSSGLKNQRRFAIKIGAPSASVASEWGDYHFAEALKDALLALGHVVRIDCLDKWDTITSYSDDCVIVLRGLSTYVTKPFHCNILWIISHPDLISSAECESYDVVFTASRKHCDYLNGQGIKAELLLQCTDARRFKMPASTNEHDPSNKAIFVGNTRNVFRPIVKHAVEHGLEFDVIGAGWRDFIPASYIVADFAPNQDLPKLYGSASFVLNDHWQSMRRWGFISNRVFDVVACGAPCLTDDVDGLDDIFGPMAVIYDGTSESFSEAVTRALMIRRDSESRSFWSLQVSDNHTFTKRAETIIKRFEDWERILLEPRRAA